MTDPFIKIELDKREEGHEVANSQLAMPDEKQAAERLAADKELSPQIAEYNRAIQELTEERNLLRRVIDNIPDIIYVKDKQGRYLINNLAHFETIPDGPTQQEVLGKTDFDLFPPDMAAQSRAEEQEIIASGQASDQQAHSYLDRSKNRKWLLSSKVPLPDDRGNTTGILGLGRDITSLKLIEETLKQRASQLTLLNDIAGQIAASLAPDEMLTRAARLIQEAYGYHQVSLFLIENETVMLKAAAGSFDETVLKNQDHDFERGIVGWVAANGEELVINDVNLDERYLSWVPNHDVTQAELCLPIKMAGSTLGVLDLQSPHLNAFGETDILAMQALANQIAVAIENGRLYQTAQQELVERRRAEVTYRESEVKYRTLIEQSNDAIYVIFGNRFEIINPKFEELFGVTLEDANSPDFVFTNIVAPKSREQVIERAKKEKAGQKVSPRYEFTALDKYGNEIEVDLSVSYPTYRGGIATQGVIRDITERKRAEVALANERALLAQRVEERTAELSAANAQLARAARLKDEFLANMSHELRTPLNAILGFSETLQEEVYGPLNEQQQKSLRSVEESGRHLLALINDILDLSKIEAGKVELQTSPFSVEMVCQASLRMIKQMAHQKRLKVSSSIDSAVTVVEADARRLKQILVNLLTNAVKFTPEGGSIGLEVIGDADQEVVHFSIWDTGIGIAKEDLGRLFQSFVQVDSSLARQHAGTGLGLALIRRLTELHGGGVSLESELGQGSRFTVSLPWKASGAEAVDEDDLSSEMKRTDEMSLTAQTLVLLADDNETNIGIVSDYLKLKGFQIVVARNGAEAVERAKADRPGIILMDIQMPEMDGMETIRRIRKDDKLVSTPVIAVTALAMPGDRERCLKAGASDYLSKPVSLKRLINVIATHLQKVQMMEQEL